MSGAAAASPVPLGVVPSRSPRVKLTNGYGASLGATAATARPPTTPTPARMNSRRLGSGTSGTAGASVRRPRQRPMWAILAASLFRNVSLMLGATGADFSQDQFSLD